jgi:beta-glucanase (GH16 family)
MNSELTDAQASRLKRLARTAIILAAIVGLMAFYPLAACAGGGGSAYNTSPTATALARNQPVPWKLAWHDEFGGSAGTLPDPGKWTPNVGGNGWGSKHLEYDTNNQNAYLDGQGDLVLEARQQPPDGPSAAMGGQAQNARLVAQNASWSKDLQCWYGPCQYTSARISTSGHFSFKYGFLVARIKIPYGQGIWPAFWLLGSNCAKVGWPTCGEIDVMENIGNQQAAVIHGSVHGPGNPDNSYMLFSKRYTLPHGAFADDFHTFALQWNSDHLSFYVDGVNYATFDKASLANKQDWVFDHPFNIILDVAVGGNWPGNPDATTVFPQRMYISYVRLYQEQ